MKKWMLIGLLVVTVTHASTWFTGPLLAPSGETIPCGHQNYEFYMFGTDNIGYYNNRGYIIHNHEAQTVNPTLLFTQGVTSWMDLQLSLPYEFNNKSGKSDSNMGDIAFTAGFQLLHDNTSTWMPALRLSLEEIFPTGRYRNLSTNKKGTDATGAGFFQTALGFNFQKLFKVFSDQYLRTRLSLVYTVPASTSVRGLNAYGGAANTNGIVNPGNKFSADLAFEYAFAQHWVLANDFLYNDNGNINFSGAAGTTSAGLPAAVGAPGGSQFSVAPAIEYNFNSHWGVIAGSWFSVAGRDENDFVSGVIAVNYYR